MGFNSGFKGLIYYIQFRWGRTSSSVKHRVVKEEGDGDGWTKSMRRGNASANITVSHKNTYSCTVSIYFSVNSSPFRTAHLTNLSPRTQMSAACRDLDWSAASARRLFDGDDAVLHNIVRTPSRRGHRSLLAAAARFLCGRTLLRAEFFVPKVSNYQLGWTGPLTWTESQTLCSRGCRPSQIRTWLVICGRKWVIDIHSIKIAPACWTSRMLVLRRRCSVAWTPCALQ